MLAGRGQRAQLAGDAVAIGLERQPDRVVLELGPERLAVIGAGTLVEQAGGHVGQTFLARRIAGGAAANCSARDRNGIEGSRIR